MLARNESRPAQLGPGRNKKECWKLIRNSVLAALATMLLWSPATANAVSPRPASLDAGFRMLYDLDFLCAQEEFRTWQNVHPEDPLGPAGEASAYLFGEFNRLGVLEIQLLINDSSYGSKKALSADPAVRAKFDAALQKAETIAQARLANNRDDRDALFAMALTSGLRADYQALVEKRNMASLRNANRARTWGQKLLAADQNYYDGYLASGSSKYIVGNLAAPIRWVLRVQGISGDKEDGLQELKLTAEHGRYLAPLARILLAIAYLRDNDVQQAQPLLSILEREFPHNPLFPKAIARLESQVN